MTSRTGPGPYRRQPPGTWPDRWTSGAEKAEVIRGALVFTPLYAFDERDVDAARRIYPGRHVELAEGALWVLPAGSGPGRGGYEG